MWFLRWVSAVSLFLVVMCAGTVMITRLNRAPDSLQALGFDVCDGEPCWGDIKPGTVWTEVQRQFPDTQQSAHSIRVLTSRGAIVTIWRTPNGKVVDRIAVSLDKAQELPTLGAVIARYGPPCRVDFLVHDGMAMTISLIYPTMEIDVFLLIVIVGGGTISVSAAPTLTTKAIAMNGSAYSRCSDANSEASGPWYGFASTETYLARFRRASGAAPQE